MSFRIDTSKKGLEMFFKAWQVHALDHLQEIHPQGANSGTVHRVVSQKTSISRTSIINFLDHCVDDGMMTYTSTTGRGGHHRVYRLEIPGRGLVDYLVEEVISFLNREFPQETGGVLTQYKELTVP